MNSIDDRVRFCLLHRARTSSGTHLASYPMGTGVISLEVKRAGREANRSPVSSAEVKNGETIPQLPNMSSWHSA
jgi:hypothetical protein